MLDPRKTVFENPDKPAYIMSKSNEVVTRLQLEERANRCAHMFRDMGLQIGDNIAFFLENNRYFLEICHAASRAGLMFTPISTYLNISEIEYIVNNCNAKAFITSVAKKELASQLIDIMPSVAGRLMVGGVIDGFESYDEKAAAYPKTPIEDELAGRVMLYSSGTTGRPKGVKRNYETLPYGELPDANKKLIALYGLDEDTIYLSPAPLYHVAPLSFSMMTIHAGGTVVVMERFDALESLKLIQHYRVTHSQWVPTMFIRMLKLPEEVRDMYDISSMKIAIHGAAPIPIPVKEQMMEWWGPILFEAYGSSEGYGFAAITPEEWLKHKGSVGRSYIGTAHVLDEDDNELPPGEPGIIYFSDGPDFEYHNDPEKTKASRNSRGWTTLFDVGYLDEEGYLYLTDRATNMIISGGVNIYPQETENILIMHPKVVDAAVIGVPNEDFGEEVKAIVQAIDMDQAGPELEQELIEYCRSKLSKIKCPVSIDFEAELPRTNTGKLLIRLLKDRYWGGGKII